MPSEKREAEYWLYLEPYVHVSSNDHAVLFYNSLSGARFEIPASSRARDLVLELTDPVNGYVTRVTGTDLQNPAVANLVNKIRKKFMGELLNTEWSAGKPVNIYPEAYFKSHLTRKMVETPGADDLIDLDNYIHEITIYLNSLGKTGPDPCPKAFRQFIFPGNTLEEDIDLPGDALKDLVVFLSRFKITMLHISGADISRYPGFTAWPSLLSESGFTVTYHLRSDRYQAATGSHILNQKGARLAVHCSFPLDGDVFNFILNDLNDNSKIKQTDIHFIITSSEELATARQIIALTGIPNAYLSPFFNGRNFDFFKETVFITREDIRKSRPDRNQVFSRLSLNETDFGKFIVLPDRHIYANPNDAPVGRFPEDRVDSLILKEILDGISWKRTRKSVSPCNRCLYHFLCPPVSSYELVMGRFNFCDVWK